MDLKCKSMTWVGNVYQKFEAMCLEVEDVMCQETAKFVETQVQTVGASVKKFCAEVVQDLIPPSSVDAPKKEASDLSLEQNADFGTYKKPKVATKEETAKGTPPIKDPCLLPADKSTGQEQNDEVDIQEGLKTGIEEYPIKEKLPSIEMSVINHVGKYSSQELLSEGVHDKSHLLPSIAGFPVKVAESFEKNENVARVYKKLNLPTEEGHVKENPPLPEVSIKIASPGKGTNQASSFCRLCNEKHENACNTLTDVMSPTSVKHSASNSPVKTGTTSSNLMDEARVADSSSTLSASFLVPPTLSCESNVVDSGLSASKTVSSTGSNVLGTSTTCQAVSPMKSFRDENELGGAVTKVDNYISAPEIIACGKSDDDSSELGDIVDTDELGMEIVENFQNSKLEESCIVVDSKELPVIPFHKAGKQRSYKKKIRNAFASRMRSTKKQEYEQLAVWQGDIGSQHSGPSPLTRDVKLPSHDLGESEWELI